MNRKKKRNKSKIHRIPMKVCWFSMFCCVKWGRAIKIESNKTNVAKLIVIEKKGSSFIKSFIVITFIFEHLFLLLPDDMDWNLIFIGTIYYNHDTIILIHFRPTDSTIVPLLHLINHRWHGLCVGEDTR